jgi:pyruvate dehydrogenase E2 component (dihydrolipoamide acetyltransferase)
MADIVMPRLSDTMEEGTILRWLKADGDEVRRGEELVEIETDKASMTYESDQEGVVELVAREGDTLPIGEVIAHVLPTAPGGAPRAPRGHAEADGRGTRAPEPAVPPPADSQRQGSGPGSRAGAQSPAAPTPAAPMAAPQPPAPQGARPKASPLARRVARERGVALEGIVGSGPGGRIVRADVEVAAAELPAAEGPAAEVPAAEVPAAEVPAAELPAAPEESHAAPSVAGVLTAKGEATVHDLSRTQQAIARRMAESKATIPHFSLESEVDMEQCVALRAELARHTDAPPPTYNDMVVKACALALREHPRVNGSYRDGGITLHGRVNVGVAVAVDAGDPLHSALIVPTVFDADIKSLGEIARASRALAERVRAGTVTPPELSGGTFTVSNLGMYGVRGFTAIINPPQAAILAVGSLEPRPAVRDGEVVARHTMALTLACDHRILYGADAARFLARVRELLETPSGLLL